MKHACWWSALMAATILGCADQNPDTINNFGPATTPSAEKGGGGAPGGGGAGSGTSSYGKGYPGMAPKDQAKEGEAAKTETKQDEKPTAEEKDKAKDSDAPKTDESKKDDTPKGF